MLEIRLLGRFELHLDGERVEITSRPARVLLAYLILTRGTQHPRERLAGLFWPDSTEENARKNLRQALWHLRKVIGKDYLLVDSNAIGFYQESNLWLDISVLENPQGSALEKAASVYEGELLPGYYEDWVLLERDRLEATYERLMERLLTQLQQERRWEETIEWSERWIAQGRTPEAAYRSLMVAYAAAGEVAKIEAVYQRCAEALQHDIGVEPSKDTMQLYQDLKSGETGSLEALAREEQGLAKIERRVVLPTHPTTFIGRKAEMAEISKIFTHTRMLTLSGSGGMGKTRLALQVAANQAPTFEHGCYFVALAPLQSSDDMVQAIAEVLRYPLATREDPRNQLLRYLSNRELLLVLDNFEHLMDGVELVSEILESAPGIKILVTSRERLNIQSETNFIIGGMGYPERGMDGDTGKQDAVELFIQRAGKVDPGFEPLPEERETIQAICETVGGMPLAIELAAAWLSILGVDEVAGELAKGLDILSTETRDTPERHRSMHAVFAHSWSLLESAEQEIFLKLSIFRGGFTREAAQKVADASLQDLAVLISKSFLSHDRKRGRFEMHELLSQFAREKLEEKEKARSTLLEAHAAYFADFMEAKAKDLRGKNQKVGLTEIEDDIGNVRAAWRYYQDQRNAPQLLKFALGLWHLYWIRWWNHAGMELFAETVRVFADAREGDSFLLKSLALALQSYFMGWVGRSEEGYACSKESVDLLKGFPDSEALVIAYHSQVLNAYFMGYMEEEKKAIQKMGEITAKLDDPWLRAWVMFADGMIALIEGEYQEAHRIAELNLKLYEELGDISGSTMSMIVLGHANLAQGDFDQAEEIYKRCLDLAEGIGFHYSIQTTSKYLAKVNISRRKTEEADAYLRKSLSITNEIGFLRDVVNLLYEYARLRVEQGRQEDAVELLALILPHPASDQSRLFEGRIRDSVRSLLDHLESTLPADVFQAAVKRGEERELEAVVAELLEQHAD